MDLSSSFMIGTLLLEGPSGQISWMELRKVEESSLFYPGKLTIKRTGQTDISHKWLKNE